MSGGAVYEWRCVRVRVLRLYSLPACFYPNTLTLGGNSHDLLWMTLRRNTIQYNTTLTWDPGDLGSQTDNILQDPGDPESSLSKLS